METPEGQDEELSASTQSLEEGESSGTDGQSKAAASSPQGKRAVQAFLQRLADPALPVHALTGMYKDWFLDYASYVVLERAIPNLADGLKPVQRRILHSMKTLEDGWYHKVANIIGHTMQYHPHGDASIGSALVQLGQKDLLIDPQGNWGNILTGDGAAAPRYIEARLTKFALDVVFDPKNTEWTKSYDGRNQEPVTLPAKFPLLLAQGATGIAVGVSTFIFPHNFNEIVEAAVAYLKGQEFSLLPDFPTGGLVDCARYADGQRGGRVKIRARIQKTDKKTLTITEIPFTKTTATLIESIRKANDEGKIRVKRVEDNTAANAEIVLHLAPDVSPDKTIDALYIFTDCEVTVSPSACVIDGEKPLFLGVSDILRASVDRTRDLLADVLRTRLKELEDTWHFASLERIFIENSIYEFIKVCKTKEAVLQTIEEHLQPFVHLLRRPLVKDDIVRLTEIKVMRFSLYDSHRADELIRKTEQEMQAVQDDLADITGYTIRHFKRLGKEYGAAFPRRTEVVNFEEILATRVVAANKKLYVDRKDGFFGTDLKDAEYVGECSDIDDVLVILRSGRYMITPVAGKKFFDKDILHIGVYNRADGRTTYNVIYRDGRNSVTYVKRCAIGSLIRDREYNLTQGSPGSSILYMSVNPNGEAEVVRVSLVVPLKMKNPSFDFDFATLAIRGRAALGNILTKKPVGSVKIKERGVSTLGDRKVWIDRDVNRLNFEGRGELLGEFGQNDCVLAVYAEGTFQTLPPDPSTRFGEHPILVKKFDPGEVFTVAYYDAGQGYYYLKRCSFEAGEATRCFISEDEGSRLECLSADAYPRLVVSFAGKHIARPPEEVDAEQFIGVKSYRAKGKRLSTLTVGKLRFGEPIRPNTPVAPSSESEQE